MPGGGVPKIYGIFGYPVRHSLSPLMQSAAFRARKIPALYLFFEVPPKRLGVSLRRLKELGVSGINITVPHKERAVSSMDALTPQAKRIGAVNTVKVSPRGLIGHNTDAEGFLRAFKHDLGVAPRGKVAALIGAGGVAKAIAVALLSGGVKRLLVYNRSPRRLKILLRHLKRVFPGKRDLVFAQRIRSGKIRDLASQGVDLLIQATSVGMDGRSCLVARGALCQGMSVYETVYHPTETPLLRLARRGRLRRSNGLGMLLYQGALSFEWWTGRKAPVQAMKQALKGKG